MQFIAAILSLGAITAAAIVVEGEYEVHDHKEVVDGGENHGKDDAHYKFEYGVHDPQSHDVHSQYEERDGKSAKGGYNLKDADGTHRVVKYMSKPHSGFEAVVKRVGYALHPAHYGDHKKKGDGGSDIKGKNGATSYIGTVHWGNQGHGDDGKNDGGAHSRYEEHDVHAGDSKESGHGADGNHDHAGYEDDGYSGHDDGYDHGDYSVHDKDYAHGGADSHSEYSGNDDNSEHDKANIKQEDSDKDGGLKSHPGIEKEYNDLEKWIWG